MKSGQTKIYFGYLLLTVAIFLSGCSTHNVNRASYDNIHTQQCIYLGGANCTPKHLSFDEYQHLRAAIPY
ncbi:MAG: hypothetical protein COB30_010640 [Ectothiorhodospiraceae bacterium]|nr:hypothetical protein [Ectothiorhodospiraceae bacterium]